VIRSNFFDSPGQDVGSPWHGVATACRSPLARESTILAELDKIDMRMGGAMDPIFFNDVRVRCNNCGIEQEIVPPVSSCSLCNAETEGGKVWYETLGVGSHQRKNEE
jgi:hypothetical protein